jgi:putative two-component system response regulator
VLPIIRHHHEKLNGTGYRDGLTGDQIPFTTRILQVTDVYDALTTDRPYRAALSREDALHIKRAEVARGWWESSLVNELETYLIEQEIVMEGRDLSHLA